nr:MAG TPA: hypothetical protein [Caudoviricetes sp.]
MPFLRSPSRGPLTGLNYLTLCYSTIPSATPAREKAVFRLSDADSDRLQRSLCLRVFLWLLSELYFSSKKRW